MNFARGSVRLLLVAFIAWTVFVCVDVAARELQRANQAVAADCQIRKQTVADFNLQKCLDDPSASDRKRQQVIEGAKAWFLNGGYVFWLVPPFLFTAVAVILIAAGAFVYRGFAET
jgi:Flp pilus assembly protein TadB